MTDDVNYKTAAQYSKRLHESEGFDWLSQKTRTLTVKSGVEVITKWDFEHKNCDVEIQPIPVLHPKNQTLFGYEIFGCFFRDFDGALNAFKNQGLTWATPDGPFNGMNEDWIKKNIREVYVHGTSELERLNNIGNGGPINTQTD